MLPATPRRLGAGHWKRRTLQAHPPHLRCARAHLPAFLRSLVLGVSDACILLLLLLRSVAESLDSLRIRGGIARPCAQCSTGRLPPAMHWPHTLNNIQLECCGPVSAWNPQQEEAKEELHGCNWCPHLVGRTSSKRDNHRERTL